MAHFRVFLCFLLFYFHSVPHILGFHLIPQKLCCCNLIWSAVILLLKIHSFPQYTIFPWDDHIRCIFLSFHAFLNYWFPEFLYWPSFYLMLCWNKKYFHKPFILEWFSALVNTCPYLQNEEWKTHIIFLRLGTYTL